MITENLLVIKIGGERVQEGREGGRIKKCFRNFSTQLRGGITLTRN